MYYRQIPDADRRTAVRTGAGESERRGERADGLNGREVVHFSFVVDLLSFSLMKEPWQSYVQLGVVHFMAYPVCLSGDGPQFETLAQICHDPFFEAVDLGPINDANE